jgi:acetolactate synthase-1/2/3 large subunit
MNRANLLVAALENEGAKQIFGVPGAENLDLVEARRRSKIELAVARHEQAAAFMAATHGRLTGEARVCLSMLGPGALNLTTGAADALAAVMITGQTDHRGEAAHLIAECSIPDPHASDLRKTCHARH